MGDQNQPPLEALDGLGQGVDGLNVQMVGGLIQQQQVGVLHADHAKHDATLLTITQLTDLGSLHAPCMSNSSWCAEIQGSKRSCYVLNAN